MRRGGTKVDKNTGEKTNREAKRGEFLKSGRGQLPHVFFSFPLLDSAVLIFKMIWPSEFPVPPALSVKCLPFTERILKPPTFSVLAVQPEEGCFSIYD